MLLISAKETECKLFKEEKKNYLIKGKILIFMVEINKNY